MVFEASDQLGGSSPMERGICELESLYCRHSVDHIRKGLQYFGVSRETVGLCIFLGVPEAVGDRFRSVGSDKRSLITKSFLLAQDGDNLVLGNSRKLCSRIGLELQSHLSSKHFCPSTV